jgi:hypothetical protein
VHLLFLRAYLKLIYFDLRFSRHNFARLHETVRRQPIATGVSCEGISEHVCSTVDIACVWYWKEVLCLQRSAVAVQLLRLHGVPAELVIGAQRLPFKAHAWVEVKGEVINDKPYTRDLYAILDRC